MKYKEYNVSQSAGIILGSSLRLDEKVYPKGYTVTPEDVLIFKMYDLHFIYGAEYEDGDIEYKTAYGQIAALLCGGRLGYVIDGEYCLITATDEGILFYDQSRINKFNSFNPDIILNVLPPFCPVKSGDVVAKLEILPPLLAQKEIDDILFRLSGNTPMLSLVDNHRYRAVCLYPYILGNEAERQHFTALTVRLLKDLADLNLQFSNEINGSYNLDNLANSFYQAINSGADIVFAMSPLKGYGPADLMAHALRTVTDDVFICSIPQIGLGDMIIAEKSGRRIIVLPYDYDQGDDKFIDNVIRQTIFSEHLNSASFAHLASPLLPQRQTIKSTDKIIASSGKISGAKAKIGAVILAAGQGRRSGVSKLLVEGQDGLPMFMHSVNAAIASHAKPVFVITGHRHEEMEEWLEKLDVNVIYNPSFESGIKTSIRLGLKAMPSSCDGAILIPADMPNIGAAELNKLITKFDASQDKQLVYFTHKGIKNNPIIWSKSLYDKADLIPENSEFRVVFAEHSDYSKAVEIKDADKLLDINFPNDVKEYAQK